MSAPLVEGDLVEVRLLVRFVKEDEFGIYIRPETPKSYTRFLSNAMIIGYKRRARRGRRQRRKG